MPEKLAFKKEASFFCYKKRMIFFLPLSTENDQHKNMEKLLSLIESSQPEPTTEKEKLRYVISKISIWDYFKIFLKASTRHFVSMKSLACSINIILNCMKSIMGEAIFGFCSCFVSCCLEFFACFWLLHVWCFLAFGKEILNGFLRFFTHY